MVRFLLYFCVILTLAASVTQSRAASYQFVNIVDSAGPFTDSFSVPAINNSGTVAFGATLDAGGAGIFVGSGGAVTTLYDSSGPFREFDNHPDINDSGTVSFSASFDAGGGGGFIGNGGPATPITGGGGLINNQGTLAFGDGNGNAIFVNSGGTITTIADTSGPFRGNLVLTSLNDSGTVGFFAWHDDGNGIFTGSGGAITTVALEGAGEVIQDVQINNAGTVAFVLHDFNIAFSAIFVGSPGSLTTFADSSGPFGGIEPWIGLNNNDQVAFYGYPDAGGEGIFAGPDPLADKVIQIGDVLFGSNVTYLGFQHGLNDTGDVVFGYHLANGINGIAVATPIPEPCGFALATLGLCVVALSQRRGRQRQDKTKGGVNNIRSIG